MHRPCRRGVFGAERRREHAVDSPLELARPGLAHAVAHQVHAAALPRRALEHFLYGLDLAYVSVGCDRLAPMDAAVADRAQEPEPRVAGLGVHNGQARHMLPAAPIAAYRGHRRGGAGSSASAALHVCGIEPQIRRARFAKIAPEQLGDVGIEVVRHRADLVLRQFGNAEPLGDPLHLARRRTCGVHLGHRRHHGAVDALLALDDILGEEAAAAQLGYAQRDVARVRDQVALAVAVAAVGASSAQLVCLGIHYRVDHVLDERPYQFSQVYRSVCLVKWF